MTTDEYFSKFPSGSYDLTNFYAHVNGVNHNVRRILDYLEENNTLDNTLIIFTLDNGAQAGLSSVCGPTFFPEMPLSPVPLVFSWPAEIKNNRVLEQLVSTMDIIPTLIHAAGGEVPGGLDGKSLLSLLIKDSEDVVHERLMWAESFRPLSGGARKNGERLQEDETKLLHCLPDHDQVTLSTGDY